jgi:hypothetical protein
LYSFYTYAQYLPSLSLSNHRPLTSRYTAFGSLDESLLFLILNNRLATNSLCFIYAMQTDLRLDNFEMTLGI